MAVRSVEPEKIVFQGKIVEVVQQLHEIAPDKTIVFEWGRRAPGIRLIIASNNKVLLTKEYRHELKRYDYRLPGGKVFDSLDEYNVFLKSGRDVLKPAAIKAREEAREEAGIMAKDIIYYATSKCGATFEWDLYYFVVSKWEETEQALEDGEDITGETVSFKEAERIALDGRMSEERSALILLRYLTELKR
jgi:8-oxo-dGTP pyrophosphatase MutT (NUDIX family)